MNIKEQLRWLPVTQPINSSSDFLMVEYTAGLPQNRVTEVKVCIRQDIFWLFGRLTQSMLVKLPTHF